MRQIIAGLFALGKGVPETSVPAPYSSKTKSTSVHIFPATPSRMAGK